MADEIDNNMKKFDFLKYWKLNVSTFRKCAYIHKLIFSK